MHSHKQVNTIPEKIIVSDFKTQKYTNFRSSFTKIPYQHSLLKTTGIPFVITLNLENYTKRLKNISNNNDIIRCEYCKSYINPYIEIIHPGLQWKCNLCYTINKVDVPFEKQNEIRQSKNTKYFDIEHNIENNVGCYNLSEINELCYELQASPKYILKTPPPQTIVFIFEISYFCNKNNIFSSSFEILLNILEEYNKKTKFCFMFCNTRAFVLRKDGSLLVVSDFDDVPIFFTDDIFFEAKNLKIDLRKLLHFFENDYIKGNDFGGALVLSKKMLQKTGGTIISFLSSVPNIGKGAVDQKNTFYKDIALEFSHLAISHGFCLFPQTNIDLSVISEISKKTGGFINYYPNYNGNELYFTTKLANDLSSYFDLNIGCDAICRIRANKGVTIKKYYGTFTQKKHELLSFCNFNPSQSITFECEVKDIYSTSICFQAAMLRTVNGSKMIHIQNFVIPVDFQNMVYNYTNPSAIAHFLAIKAVSLSEDGIKYNAGTDFIINTLKNIMKRYKENTSQNNLNLPSSLHALPLLCLSACKTVNLRHSNYTPADYRIYYSYLINTSYPKVVDYILYPLLIPLHDLINKESVTIENIHESAVNLSLNYLEVDGFYLLDTGVTMFFFVGCECDNQLVDLVIDSDVPTGRFILENHDNAVSQKINCIIAKLRDERFLSPNSVLVRDTESTNIFKDIFFSYFVEDKSHGLPSYKQFLDTLKD